MRKDNKMKDLFIDIGYLLLALVLLGLEAFFRIVIGLPYLLWKKVNYEAQCLRHSGGGWGHSMKEGARERRMGYRSARDDHR